jgi:hypothetical protein
MTTIDLRPTDADLFGRKVASRLADSTAELPYEVTERLRAARTRAVAARRLAAQPQPAQAWLANGGGTAALGGDEDLNLWGRIASALPAIALVAGLVLIHSLQNDLRASEVAEVDTAILTDDLPPAAYADPGFVQFLKTGGE